MKGPLGSTLGGILPPNIESISEIYSDGSLDTRAPRSVTARPIRCGQPPTGYKACMVGIPDDDLAAGRAIYATENFALELETVVAGIEVTVARLRAVIAALTPELSEVM